MGFFMAKGIKYILFIVGLPQVILGVNSASVRIGAIMVCIAITIEPLTQMFKDLKHGI